MSDAHGVARDQLRAFVERIERLEEEKKTIADDIKDVYGEAKGMGFDTKILKKVVALRKKDEQERMEEDAILDTYLHLQAGRGVNAVAVVIEGGTEELAHDIAVHIAFAKPAYLKRDEVPAADAERERQALLDITKAEGKPEQAWDKIVEGRLNAWYKEQVLLEQGFVRDDKQTITQLLGDATLVRFAQVYIGG